MTTRKAVVSIGAIDPHAIYRTSLAPSIFGYGPQRARDLEKNGLLPPSFPLTESSKARVWTGAQVLEHRARMRELAEQQAKAERERPKTKQEQPVALQKIKKVKLRPPSKADARS
jgi:hypothetical protein